MRTTAERSSICNRLKWIARGGIPLLALGFVSCGPQQRTIADTDPRGWEKTAHIRLLHDDTLGFYNATFFFRCNKEFKEDTLTVHISTYTPDSLRCEEWFLLALQHPTKVRPAIQEITIPYRHHILLPRKGTYHFRITPTHPVAGIEAVGINLKPEEQVIP